jgi:putative ABC transport system permease protein
MFKSILTTTLRNLWKNKVYSIISVLGLAVSIACTLLIAKYVFYELSYDHYHEKKDQIYRLTSILDFNGEIDAGLTSMASGPTIARDFPEVESFVRFRTTGQNVEITNTENQVFNISNIWMTDSTVFNVFSYPFIQGEPGEALKAPRSIVLTESLAQKLFGTTQDLIGEQLKLNNTFVNITGVMKDVPKNSEMPIEGLVSMSTLPQPAQQAFMQDWFRIGFYTYLLFQNQPDISAFEGKMVDFEEKYVHPWAEANGVEAGLEYHITPLTELHFDTGKEYDMPKGNMSYIYIFSLLALFILLIAAINYVNLSLAQGTRRAREIGVRKTLGASRRQIIMQFLGESVVIAMLAALVGMVLVERLLPVFNSITQTDFTLGDFTRQNLLLVLLGVVLTAGLLAGAYPAVAFSQYRPLEVLKGGGGNKNRFGLLRKGLILLQFVFSIFMITSTLLIKDQMDYIRGKNLGFDKENLVSVNLPRDTAVARAVDPWMEELRNDTRIVQVSRTSLPTGGSGELMFRIEKPGGGLTERAVKCLFVDEHFIDVLGLNLLEGRSFQRDIATDVSQAFVINQKAAEAFGWNEEAMDKRVQWGLNANGAAANDGKVVGVVENFHYQSLHNPLEPLILCYNPNGGASLSVRFAKGDYSRVLMEMEGRWGEISVVHPFEYSFFEDDLEQNYVQEKRMETIFTYFSLMAIILASLGLFALLSFTIETRVKEIGIRKVLGASLLRILWVLVKDFVYLLLLAFLIATPINIYLRSQWMTDFAYQAPLSLPSIFISLILAVFVALVTIAYHSIKVARTEPVYSLRYE